MKREDVIEILKGYKQRLDTSCSNQLDADKEAFDFAIDALETGEIYMTGGDYNLFLEGYKQGKKDFERPQGYWNYIQAGMAVCPFCGGTRQDNRIEHISFCNKCGSDMRGKEK